MFKMEGKGLCPRVTSPDNGPNPLPADPAGLGGETYGNPEEAPEVGSPARRNGPGSVKSCLVPDAGSVTRKERG